LLALPFTALLWLVVLAVWALAGFVLFFLLFLVVVFWAALVFLMFVFWVALALWGVSLCSLHFLSGWLWCWGWLCLLGGEA
jgi:hypothetical protein